MTLTSPIPPTAPPAPPPHGAKPALTEEDLTELRHAAAYANPEADCDLIMKGGITSGVVYPLTACQLAKRYRFRRLGGASAGAIAATSPRPPNLAATTPSAPTCQKPGHRASSDSKPDRTSWAATSPNSSSPPRS
jgi:hypothetical protein